MKLITEEEARARNIFTLRELRTMLHVLNHWSFTGRGSERQNADLVSGREKLARVLGQMRKAAGDVETIARPKT